jgi:hypothetical protein
MAVPAGVYNVKMIVPFGADVVEQVIVQPGVTTTREIVVSLYTTVVNYMVSTFPIYNSTDPDLRLPRPQDGDSSSNVLSALLWIERLSDEVSYRNEPIAYDWGSNNYYYNFAKTPLVVATGFKYMINLISYQSPNVYNARLDQDIGYYGIAVTNDLYAPISYRISDDIDAMPKNNPEYGGETRSLTYWWLDPEAQTWLDQKGEFKDATTGEWIDQNSIPALSPDFLTVGNKTNLNARTGYVHLGDTDCWVLDLTNMD